MLCEDDVYAKRLTTAKTIYFLETMVWSFLSMCDHSEFADVPVEQGGLKLPKKTFRVKWRKTRIMAIIRFFGVDLIVEVGWDGF